MGPTTTVAIFTLLIPAAIVARYDGGPGQTRISVLLVASPYAGHVIPQLALGEELVRRGHSVTLVTGPTNFIQKEAERLNIALWSIGEEFITTEDLIDRFASGGALNAIVTVMEMMTDFQERVLKTIDNPGVKSYDIIVVDGLFSTFSLCFSRKWDIPAVNLWPALLLTPFDMHAWTHPLYNSDFTDNLGFFQRLISSVVPPLTRNIMEQILPRYFPFLDPICADVNMSFYESVYRADYLPQIIASSIGFEFPRVLLPLTEYVGPIISQSPSPLPPDMAGWLDTKEPGSVLYVSMGSTAVLTTDEAQSILSGAAEANLSVVWSLRESNQDILESLVYDSEGVLVANWVPQLTLLQHPTTHSALLHGGLGGVQEALSCGIPIIVVPFFGDQLDNAVRVHHHHYGRMIHRHQLTTELVSHSLRLFDSELYRTSLQKIQRIYRRDGGATRAADLLEFYSEVGYEHLVPSYAKYNWNWVEFYNIDVYALLALAVLLPCYLVYRLILCCFCTLSGENTQEENRVRIRGYKM